MNIDLFDADDEVLSFEKAGESPCFLNPNGAAGTPHTVRRAARVGKRAVTGNMVKLPVIRVSRGLRTSKKAIRWWVDALNGRQDPAKLADTLHQTSISSIEEAEREMAAAGLGE